jgi:hypothetical protein
MVKEMTISPTLIKAGAAIGAVAAIAAATMAIWMKKRYQAILQKDASAIAIDAYIGEKPTLMETIQAVLTHMYAKNGHDIKQQGEAGYAIVAEPSKNVEGLKSTRRAKKGEKATTTSSTDDSKPPPLIIGSLRMGFGHQRIAYGVVSWALDAVKGTKRDVYLHDIVNINSGEADFISEAETMYSLGSRTLTELPNYIETKASKISSQGGSNALRMQSIVACLFVSVLAGLDKDSPFISTHPLVGIIAVAAGFQNVVNLVVDNHAQWFVVVPGALNLVQGPRAYQELLKLGVPESELELAGHWTHKKLVADIPNVVDRRIRRIQDQKPLRLLIPVGGAGAQQSLLSNLVEACAPLVKQGKLQLFLNAGDHSHMRQEFEKQLDDSKLDFETVSTVEGLRTFRDHLEQAEPNEPRKSVTLFAYQRSYPAIETTDELANVSDVLVCKPSEMAFYSVPKLMIRRVGDHEQKSATRSAELGDGTLEARTIPEIMKNIHQFLDTPRVLINMNHAIERNSKIGIYDGLKNAVERALERGA